MTFQTPSPQFVQLIQNNLTYFQQIAADQADDALYVEQENMRRAISMGLQVDTTATAAAELLQTLESFVEHWGVWQKWIPLWQRALEKQTDSPKRWQIQIQLAFFYRMNSDYEASASLLQEVLAHLGSKEDESTFAKAHFHLGYCLFYLKRYDEARVHAQTAFNMFEHNPNIARGGTAPAQNLLGLINLYTGDAESAVQQFQDAYQGWLQSEHQEYVFFAVLNEALAHEASHRFDAALNCYQQAIIYAKKKGAVISKTRVYLNMGTLFLSQEKWIEARTAYLQIDRNALFQQGFIDPYTRLITNLGHVSMELGSLETAVSYLQEAISLWRQLEDAVMLANALDSLGDTHLRLQQPDTARDYYQEGLQLVQHHPDDYIAQELIITLSEKLADL